MGRGDGKGNASGGAFTDEQVGIYKECFKLMDVDKDGVINKNDLRAAFDNVGKGSFTHRNENVVIEFFCGNQR